MSDTEQREMEMVSGVIEGIIQKGPDKWQVAVKPDGSQYAKNLWTKDAELVTALSAKIGQVGAFVCGVSHWTNNEGKPIRSLWIDSLSDGTENVPERVATATAPVQVVSADGTIRTEYVGATPAAAVFVPKTDPGATLKSNEGMTPEKWDAKERRDYRSRAWAQTLAAFQHTIKVDEMPEHTFRRLQPFQRKVYQDVCQSFAFPEGDEDIPFD